MQVLVTHQSRKKGLALGSIQCSRRAKQKRKYIDLPKMDIARDRKDSQSQRQHTHRRLSDHQELALVEMICSKSGPRQQKKLRCKLQRHDDSHSGGIMMGELRKDEPVLSNTLHPGTDVGNQSAR